MDAGARMAIGSAMLFLANGRIIANLIYGGVLERHPTLKVVSVESGVGWLPSFLTRSTTSSTRRARHAGQALVEAVGVLPPADGRVLLVRDDGALIREAIKQVGEDNCMFETDFPHPTCLYPDGLDYADAALEGVDDDTIAGIMGLNAGVSTTSRCLLDRRRRPPGRGGMYRAGGRSARAAARRTGRRRARGQGAPT